MERRVLLAIFLSFLVLYVYQALVVKPVPKPPATPAPAEVAGSNAAGTTPPAPTSAPTNIAAVEAETPPASGATPVVSESAERDIRVENRDVIAVFTNRGGRLRSWRVKHYFDQAGQPQELIANKLAGQPLPFTLRIPNDDKTSATLNTALFAVNGAPAEGPVSAPVDLQFEYRDNAGLHA